MKADYSKGKIYIIKNHVNDMVYIGSTTSALSKRFSEHKGDCNRQKDQHRPLYQDIIRYGIEVFYIELLEECNAIDKLELRKREGYYIQKYKEDGCSLYNSIVAGRDQKEYREANKDKIKEYRETNRDKMKEYREANREQIVQYNKDYHEANKEKIKEYRSQQITCECGAVVTLGCLARHKRTNKHISKV